ncbi:MAG: hypothetical protein Q9166_007584 [cf. Caloplaca sp. 2 TL-2023]
MKTLSTLQLSSLAFLFASSITAFPVDDLERRENACIALGNCPGMSPQPAPSTTPAPTPRVPIPPTPPAPNPPTPPVPIPPTPRVPIPPTSSAPSPITSQPASSSLPIASGLRGPDPTLSIERAAMSPYLYGCTSAQKKAVKQAWSEAGQLADAHAEWTPPGYFDGGSYQPAMDMYIGTESKDDDPWIGTGPLKKNILRQQGIHATNKDWSPYWSYAYIYCDESKVPSKPEKPKKPQCNSPNNPGKKVMAYTFPDDGSIFGWNAKYVVLCPRFFEDDILSLADQTAAAKKNVGLQKVMDPWRKVKARSLFHETYHWGPAEVSDPRCDRTPEIYDASKVVNLASTENVAGSKTNAESWAQAAMAMYVQRTFSLSNPPVPQSQAAADVKALLSNTTFVDDIEEQFFASAPDWFAPPVATDAANFSPDMANVEQISG